MTNFDQLEKEICLQKLIKMLGNRTIAEKNKILSRNLDAKRHFKEIQKSLGKIKQRQEYLLKSLLVVKGHNIVFDAIKANCLEKLLDNLSQVDTFFQDVGGVVGYQHQVSKILKNNNKYDEKISFHRPFFIDISTENLLVRKYIREGIERLDQMAEIYVVGGAADRLHLIDEKSLKRLPAAMMKFFSKELLVRLIEDLKAKEHLYEKIVNKKIITPIALMCSEENDNFNHIKSLIKKHNYFNRGVENFFFIVQSSVPVVKKDGSWVHDQGNLLLKPSGHGALWKLAEKSKLFEWLFAKKRTKALIRQINNPIAGTDYGLIAFTGYGLKEKAEFGFASCQRQVDSAEGVNAVVEKKQSNHFEYFITNIEYCELEKFQTKYDFSKFSSNTNLLFVDLKSVKEKIKAHPYPGILINFKPIKVQSREKSVIGGRLETTMQNISDAFIEKYQRPLKYPYQLSKAYVTYNVRAKTISTAKRAYISNKKHLETPQKCFYDFISNAYDLLKNYCSMDVPKIGNFETFNASPPPFLFNYHPALGPIYNLIGKKLRKGILKHHSELVLQIAEFFCTGLYLNGSFRVFAKDLSARCLMDNVRIENKGINYSYTNDFWKGEFSHFQKCDIYLGENATLIANNIKLANDQTFIVPDNETVEIIEDKGEYFLRKVVKKYEIKYRFAEDNEIIAEKRVSSQL